MTGMVMVTRGGGCAGKTSKSAVAEEHDKQEDQQLSLLDFILSALRKSMVSTCRVDRQDREVISTVHHMEIGWPTNVQHLTHVTFDRFHGFLGLPVEFEVEIPCRAPSASISVFGVSAESMQCSYDTQGNSVPTILLLMQERLYAQDGLKSEGIFRINPENSHEEHVRDQLNRGIVPEDIDVHCLAGLIKAWFRELPSGVLDGLSPDEVLQCNAEEEECVELIKQLKPTETALLGWAVDLMADVVEQEEYNKMNARNIAMVFAPNMTQMSDPLTALMHAVQVMNLLKTLITRTLREREEAAGGPHSTLSSRLVDRQTDDEYDSHQEMDMSCGSSPPASDDDEQAQYSHSPCSEDKDEVESLSEMEDHFLRRLDENESAKNGFRKQLEAILCRELVSPTSGDCSFNADSCLTSSDSRIGSSCLSTSDGQYSRTASIAVGLKIDSKTARGSDINMADSMAESVISKQSCIPNASIC